MLGAVHPPEVAVMDAPIPPELAPPTRLLLGPGPSQVHPRVLRAMSTPLLGHLDPRFLEIMNEVQAMLRTVFRTQNPFTIAVSGTGSAGMEAALVNLVEPGDAVVVVVAGVFGTRMADIVGRAGGRAVKVVVPWGEVCEPARLEEALAREGKGKVKAVALVHAETSTGAHQPVEELSRLAHAHGALLVLDTVTSLGGVPVEVDGWEVDACYSGTQKCLSCPPGLAPFTLSPRALEVVRARRTPVQSWYLDAGLVADYWAEGKRVYHHTAPISMVYALREALRLVLEEGLPARFARHRLHSAALLAGTAALGCVPQAAEGHRLPMLNCVRVPPGVDEATARRALLADHGIEIGGGLGPLSGQVWRVGLMGESARQEHVLAVLAALEQALGKQGKTLRPGAALSAAMEVYARG
jgi:alanine-glyoxylate transaminase/serine-glyoxylate transaminase/serine-pyruvate transaminase